MYELNCRRCGSWELLELARLAGDDHTVYRCRDCGFLFSPPDEASVAARGPGIEPSPLRRHPHPSPLPSRERGLLSRGG